MGIKTLRVVIWFAIVVVFVRGLGVMDSGPSANTHEIVAAGLCLVAAMVSATLMFCFDLRKPT